MTDTGATGQGDGEVSVTEDDRKQARDLLFPELANEMPHNLARLQFSDEAEGQMERIATALADERERARAQFRAILDMSPQLTSEDGALRGYLVSLPLLGTIGFEETQ